MGNSGKFAVVTGIVALGLLVLTGMTLALPVFFAFVGVLALAFMAAVGEVLVRGRRVALVAAGACFSLAIGFSLAFLSTWELAFAGERSFIGTPLPTGDPDDYFYGAGAATVATLLVLLLGAAWPAGRRAKQKTGVRRGQGQTRPGQTRAGRTSGARNRSSPAQQVTAPRTQAQRPSAPRTQAQRTTAQRTPTPRTPAPRPPSTPAAGNGSRPSRRR